MSTDEYAPSEARVRTAYRYYADPAQIHHPDTLNAEVDRFLARVRRDAAREFVDRVLLDWGIGEDEDNYLCPATADDLRAAVDVVHQFHQIVNVKGS